MMLFLIIILSIYFAAIGFLIYGFSIIKPFNEIGLKPKNKFTIIVPFRNEAENLPILLDSFSKLNYPPNLFEVILVDDQSKEKYKVQSLKFKVTIINNIRTSNSPKKDAIITAMNVVDTEWVITTDADCVVNTNWLLVIDNYIQKHAVEMLAGAVTFDSGDSFLHQFQHMDMASLQGATIGSFGIGKGFMCNGANLAYTKNIFHKLNGFKGNDKIASGDDVFLLQKAIAQFPEKVHYLKSEQNIVTTKPLNDWKSLFYQRVRWASKTTSYQSSFGKILGIIVFFGNMSWFLGFGFWLLSIFPFQNIIILSLIKFPIDSILIRKTNTFFGQRGRHFLLGSLLYPLFSVTVAIYSLFGTYEWKGRQF